MGQKMSVECGCQVLESTCGPQDPASEQQSQLRVGNYTHLTTSEPDHESNVTYPSPPTDTYDESLQRSQQAAFGAQSHGAPPLQQDHYQGMAAPPPINSETSSRGPGAAHREVGVDDILSNLEGSEDALYGNAFTSFLGGTTNNVMLDCMQMRDFVVTNTSISMPDIDMELLKVATPDDGLSRDGFLHLLREFAVSDGAAIGQFMGLSGNGESLAAEECRSGLLLFCQEQLQPSFGDDLWECIFNAVLWDAAITVMLENWMAYCKTAARMVRLLRYAQL